MEKDPHDYQSGQFINDLIWTPTLIHCHFNRISFHYEKKGGTCIKGCFFFSFRKSSCAPSQVEQQNQMTLGEHAVCHLAILIYQQLSE